MPVGIEVWVTQIPPITRGWLILAVLTSLAVVSESYTSPDGSITVGYFVAMSPGDTPSIIFQL
jgi:hypothetical protein